jgi:hypothetical protein
VFEAGGGKGVRVMAGAVDRFRADGGEVPVEGAATWMLMPG